MSSKKCKNDKKAEVENDANRNKKYKCKKCNLTSNKEKKLCKPEKN